MKDPKIDVSRLISLAEYAKLHGKAYTTVRQKAQRGGFQTLIKIGGIYLIDREEPYSDHRVISGKYVNWRKSKEEEKDGEV